MPFAHPQDLDTKSMSEVVTLLALLATVCDATTVRDKALFGQDLVEEQARWEQDALNHLLQSAVASLNVKAVRSLLKRGADIDFVPDGSNGFAPLHWASSEGNLQLVDCLLDSGPNVHQLTDLGLSAMMLAANAGHRAVVTKLISAGSPLALVDKTLGLDALMMATIGNAFAIVQDLLGAGAGCDTRGRGAYEGLSALDLALEMKHADVADMLLAHGCSRPDQTQAGVGPATSALESWLGVCSRTWTLTLAAIVMTMLGVALNRLRLKSLSWSVQPTPKRAQQSSKKANRDQPRAGEKTLTDTDVVPATPPTNELLGFAVPASPNAMLRRRKRENEKARRCATRTDGNAAFVERSTPKTSEGHMHGHMVIKGGEMQSPCEEAAAAADIAAHVAAPVRIARTGTGECSEDEAKACHNAALPTSAEPMEDSLCVVCLDATPTIVLLSCAHLCLCTACSDKIHGKCPVCSGPIASRLRVYAS